MKKFSIDELSFEFPTLDNENMDSIKGGGSYGPNYGVDNFQWGSMESFSSASSWSQGIADDYKVGYSPSHGEWGYWTSTQTSDGYGVSSQWHSITEAPGQVPSWFTAAYGTGSGGGGNTYGSGGGVGSAYLSFPPITAQTFTAAMLVAGLEDTAAVVLGAAFAEIAIPAAIAVALVGYIAAHDAQYFDPYDKSKWVTSTGQPDIPSWLQPVTTNNGMDPLPDPDNMNAWVKALFGGIGLLVGYDQIADKMGWPRLDPWDNLPPKAAEPQPTIINPYQEPDTGNYNYNR